MNFDLSEDHVAIRDLAARIFAEQSDDARLKAFAESGAPFDAALWASLAETGLLGAGIDLEFGGSGLGLIEVLAVLEEQGRRLAPVPLLSTVVAAMALQAFGGAEEKAGILPGVAKGTLMLTAALEESGANNPFAPRLQATREGNGWRLNGAKICVPYAEQADFILVSGSSESGAALFLVPRDVEGLQLVQQNGTTGEPQAALQLDGVFIPGGGIAEAAAALDWTVQRWMAGLCAQQVGVSAEALRQTAAFVSERRQFGRAIGSFQAVQHRAADAYVDIEAMRSTALKAGWLLSEGHDAKAEVLAAKFWACRGGHRVAQSAQHLHGGAGADISYPIHRFFLRAKQIELTLGGAGQSLARLGTELAHGAARRLS